MSTVPDSRVVRGIQNRNAGQDSTSQEATRDDKASALRDRPKERRTVPDEASRWNVGVPHFRRVTAGNAHESRIVPPHHHASSPRCQRLCWEDEKERGLSVEDAVKRANFFAEPEDPLGGGENGSDQFLILEPLA